MSVAVTWEHSVHSRSRPVPPGWVAGFLHREGLHPCTESSLIDSGDFALAFARVAHATSLNALDLQCRTVQAYESIAATLAPITACHPIRFWNFIPQLNQPMGDGLDRYMVFNAGRFAAFARWYGANEFMQRVATASGVGHNGDDLLIWCLAARRPGVAVENPRQRPSYTYSPRFGPLPPCFARAMIVNAPTQSHDTERLLLVSGTASIRDEATTGVGRPLRQTLVALQNLAIVVKAACAGPQQRPSTVNGDLRTWLSRYRHMRVYYVRAEDRSALERAIAPRLPNVTHIEWVCTSLCRPDLLVELEGVASLEEP